MWQMKCFSLISINLPVMSNELINTVNNCRSFDFLCYPPASTTKESLG